MSTTDDAPRVYGIIDPDYARVFTMARCLAWQEGYALAMHGSFTRDLDLIAVPWTDAACEPEHLVQRIADATGLKLPRGTAWGRKPHGRKAFTLVFPGFADPRFVDLSVTPREVDKTADSQGPSVDRSTEVQGQQPSAT
jgi:hypothetical protein